MEAKELKKRVRNAVRALRGKYQVEPLDIPLLKVERTPVQSIMAEYEISLDELGRRGPGFEARWIMPEMRNRLLNQMEASGLVRHRAFRFGDHVVYTARINVVLPTGEDSHG